jgi:hypothetical protein
MKAANPVRKRNYENNLLNISCGFSLDFTRHLVSSLKKYGINVTVDLMKCQYNPAEPLAANVEALV